MKIEKNIPAKSADIERFLKDISFVPSVDLIEFFKKSNGIMINTNSHYLELWKIEEMIEFNKGYDVETYAPDFFIIGTNGGGEGYAIEKATGCIFEMPFIGMGKENAILRAKTFDKFLKSQGVKMTE